MNSVAASTMAEALWCTIFAKAHREHHVAKRWPGFGQVFLLRNANLPSYINNVYPPNNLLE